MNFSNFKTLLVAATMILSGGACATAQEMCGQQYKVRDAVREVCGRRNVTDKCRERAQRGRDSEYRACLMRSGIKPPGCYVDKGKIMDCTGLLPNEIPQSLGY